MADASGDLVRGLKFVLRGPAGLTSLCQPQVYEPGEWVEAVGPLVPGHNGIHFLPAAEGVVGFMLGEQSTVRAELWWCEAEGVARPPSHDEDPTNPFSGLRSLGASNGEVFAAVCRRCRLVAPAWDAATCRSLAADLAAHAVREAWEYVAPTDRRPHEAIAAARAFVQGEISAEALATAHQGVTLAALGPTGLVPGWRDSPRARWAALAAARCAEMIPPGCSCAYLVKGTLLAALDAGVAWSACVACAERALGT